MAETAGRYCPLCGAAAGLADRSYRRCDESLRMPAPAQGRIPDRGRNRVATASRAIVVRT